MKETSCRHQSHWITSKQKKKTGSFFYLHQHQLSLKYSGDVVDGINIFQSEIAQRAKNMLCIWLPQDQVNLLRCFWPKFTEDSEKTKPLSKYLSDSCTNKVYEFRSKTSCGSVATKKKKNLNLHVEPSNKSQTLARDRQFCSDSQWEDNNNIRLCN